jgi:hypothetical protein
LINIEPFVVSPILTAALTLARLVIVVLSINIGISNIPVNHCPAFCRMAHSGKDTSIKLFDDFKTVGISSFPALFPKLILFFHTMVVAETVLRDHSHLVYHQFKNSFSIVLEFSLLGIGI